MCRGSPTGYHDGYHALITCISLFNLLHFYISLAHEINKFELHGHWFIIWEEGWAWLACLQTADCSAGGTGLAPGLRLPRPAGPGGAVGPAGPQYVTHDM
jgi:hypothetical protein